MKKIIPKYLRSPDLTISRSREYMNWAIALALEGLGTTSPNPMVGAVVVKHGRVVGEGFHRRAGLAHAEIVALRKAEKNAKGADLYVTLEPCAHFGKTPPCVPAIIDAGIKRVFVGTRDPNPIVNGRGIKELKKFGLEVHEGILSDKCVSINEVYNKFISRKIPYVTAKVALSLDGKIATSSGDSKWITNEDCRKYVHKLRAQSDAVMVGIGTVIKDDPRLNVRLGGMKSKTKAVIVDEELKIPKNSKILKRAKGDVIFATTAKAPKAKQRWIENLGHSVLVCPHKKDGNVDVALMLKLLAKLNIASVMLEGGGELFAEFFKNKLVDKLVACIAPKLIGGEGKNFLPGIDLKKIKNAITLQKTTFRTFGDNIVIDGDVKK